MADTAPLRHRLSARDLDTLARALCDVRGERHEGMRYGGPFKPEGATFLEMARRDVLCVLDRLEELPGWRAP